MALPDSFIEHLRSEGYHPRSDKHSKALARSIVEHLMAYCPEIAEDAASGRLVFDYNLDIDVGHTTWNTDLAIGPPPPGGSASAEAVGGMTRSTPASVRIAVELKSVMTEHHKAVKNRKRDFEAHHAHVHAYHPSAIAAGLLVINGAPQFLSPTRGGVEVTPHRKPEALVAHCLNEVNNITIAGGASPTGLDALAALIVSHDNIDNSATHYIEGAPAPRPGSPIHWDGFIQRICDLYRVRFT